MPPRENFTNDLVNQLVHAAIVLKRESSFVEGGAKVASETEILGWIISHYFKKSGRKIAETAYAALDDAGLVEALAFSEFWRKMNPDQNDLWATGEDDPNGRREG